MASQPGLSIQGSVPASHAASDLQHLPGLQHSKLCQEFSSASARRLQPSLAHTVCTLHFCLRVADLSYLLHTPRTSLREEITLGCQQVTQKLNRSHALLSCFVSSFSARITLAPLPNLPHLNFLFGEGGEDYSPETVVNRA